MRRSRSPIYREAFQVSPERIARLNDEDLNVLMRELLQAQAYKCGSPSGLMQMIFVESDCDEKDKHRGRDKNDD